MTSIHPVGTHQLNLWRWGAFGIAVLAYILSFFHRIAPGAIASELQTSFAIDSTRLGALAGMYFYVYTVMQLPTGVLADTLGPRRILTLGGLIACVGSIMFGLAPGYEWAAAGRLLVGLGVSVTFIAMLKLNASWFAERQFATLAGLTLLLGNLGSVLSSQPLAWLVTHINWRHVFVAAGVVSGVLGFAAWLVVRNRPEDVGLPSVHPPPTTRHATASPPHWSVGLREIMRNGRSWPGFWVSFGTSGAYFVFAGLWGVPYLTRAQGMSPVAASGLITTMLLAFAVSSLLLGGLSDRIKRRKAPLVLLSTLVTLLWTLLWFPLPKAPWLQHLYFAALGTTVICFSLGWSITKEVNDPRFSGMATSLANTGAFLAAGIFQPVFGWLLDRSLARGEVGLAAFAHGIGLMVGLSALGLVAALYTTETRARNVWQQPDT